MKLTLKTSQVVELFNAIESISAGRREAVADKDGRNLDVISKPYEFDDHKATYAMAKTRESIKPLVNAHTAAQKAIVGKFEGKMIKDLDTEVKVDIDSKLQKLADDPVEVEVFQLDIKHLKLATNKLTPSVVCDLLPMLKGELDG